MLQAALIQNMKTRPDMFGTRFVSPLPSQKVPMYSLPPIVGNTTYDPKQGETIGTQFLREKMGGVRLFNAPKVFGINEPNQNSSARY